MVCGLCVCWSLPWAVPKRLNRLRCRLCYELGWAQGTCTCIRWGPYPQEEGAVLVGGGGENLPARCKVSYISCVQSIFLALFDKWQQRCDLSLSVLHQLVQDSCRLTPTSPYATKLDSFHAWCKLVSGVAGDAVGATDLLYLKFEDTRTLKQNRLR